MQVSMCTGGWQHCVNVNKQNEYNEIHFKTNIMRFNSCKMSSCPVVSKVFVKMDDEILLNYIEQHPELYCKSDPFYKYIERKRNVWEFIGNEMNVSGEMCLRRWSALRDRYSRELRKSIAPSGSEAQLYRRWHLMDAMEFLRPHVVPRPVRCTQNIFTPTPLRKPSSTVASPSPSRIVSFSPMVVSLPSPSPPSISSPCSPALLPSQSPSPAPTTSSAASPAPTALSAAAPSPTPTQPTPAKGGKRRASNVNSDVEKSLLEAVELFKKRCMATGEISDNPILHGFGITIGSILGRMSEAKQQRAMQRILEVAFEVQREPE